MRNSWLKIISNFLLFARISQHLQNVIVPILNNTLFETDLHHSLLTEPYFNFQYPTTKVTFFLQFRHYIVEYHSCRTKYECGFMDKSFFLDLKSFLLQIQVCQNLNLQGYLELI